MFKFVSSRDGGSRKPMSVFEETQIMTRWAQPAKVRPVSTEEKVNALFEKERGNRSPFDDLIGRLT